MGLLRVLLAISVVINHTSKIFGFDIVGGQVAVQAFYIISGFYMSLILKEKYIDKNDSYMLFLSNRLLRLYPIYWFVLILIIIRTFYISVVDGEWQGTLSYYFNNNLNGFSALYLIFTNLFLAGQDAVMFMGLNISNGKLFFTKDYNASNPQLFNFLFLPQAWTIGVEILFYVIAPFLLRRNIAFIVTLIILSLALRLLLLHNGLNKDPWTYRFFPTELLFFLLGNCSYWLYKYFNKIKIENGVLLFVTVLVLLYTLFFNKLQIAHKGQVYFLTFTVALPFVFLFTRGKKWDAKIGELSYAIYLSHLFVFSMVRNVSLTNIIGQGLMTTCCTIIFSYFVVKIISEPIEKMRQRRVTGHLQKRSF